MLMPEWVFTPSSDGSLSLRERAGVREFKNKHFNCNPLFY
jgi:hypothetical protein